MRAAITALATRNGSLQEDFRMQKLSLLVAAPLALALAGAAIGQQATTPVQPSPVKRTPIGKRTMK
jgi:hypothetical protein